MSLLACHRRHARASAFLSASSARTLDSFPALSGAWQARGGQLRLRARNQDPSALKLSVPKTLAFAFGV